MEKISAPLEKRCEQCKTVKPIEQFYRTKNGRDGYMKKCKECQQALNAESKRQTAIHVEESRQKREEAKLREQERAKRIEAQQIQFSERTQKQQTFLNAWFAAQPARECVACHEMKAASEFGYSELIAQDGEFWVPLRLHRRCMSCHEQMREKQKQRVPCVICQQAINHPLIHLDGYALFGGGTKINLCCTSCIPAFQNLSEDKQRFYIRARVNLAFPSPQTIYAEIDPLDQNIRYIGRTGHTKRRHNEHKRKIHKEQPTHQSYNRETREFVETSWYSRANWMYDLAQQGISSVQNVLLDVEPAAFVIEYERRYILHAIQQGWSILNAEAYLPSFKQVRSSSLDFLSIPFADLVTEVANMMIGNGWLEAKGIEAFIHKWYL